MSHPHTPTGSPARGTPAPRRWRPTIAHVRATTCGFLLATAAALLRRPDLLVLAVPFAVIATWTVLARPRASAAAAPQVSQSMDHTTLREGETTAWRVAGDVPGAEDVTVILGPPPFAELDPESGVVTTVTDPADHVEVEIALRSVRWGRRAIGPATVVATGAWGGFRWNSVGVVQRLVTLPVPAAFDAAAPIAHPVGLVGSHRSARPGDGSEFASIRPFQVGDRLRRIHWPRSMRTGALHVTSTYSDQDSHVVLVVDALNDVGRSGGIDGAASSLDITVRAAGAVAEHHLRQGDRVSMHVIGARGLVRIPPATGTRHLRRVLDTLALIEPGTDARDRGRFHVGTAGAGALVVMLSPLVSPLALQRAVTMARHGLSVVVIDTLPADVARLDEDGDALRALAWRIRLLERRREIRVVQQAGVPVVAWRGPGSLDLVLRDLHRRSRTPRLTRR